MTIQQIIEKANELNSVKVTCYIDETIFETRRGDETKIKDVAENITPGQKFDGAGNEVSHEIYQNLKMSGKSCAGAIKQFSQDDEICTIIIKREGVFNF